ncbi:MAG: hypothetical protein DRO99_00540 [Candidatus Aenigmatarchaeota archaeon]|nr:MAG: hypothetical protein DRO99_00540 [Candidatus Aenigmarchaeota archaeon]
MNFGVYAGSGPSGIPIIGGFLLFFGAMGLAMIPGICSSWDTKSRSMAVLMLLTVMVSLVFYFAFPRQEPRYLLTYLPVFSAFGGLGVHSLVRRLPKGAGETIAVLVIVVSALSAASGLMSVSADTVSASALVSACYEIRNLTAPGDVVVSDSYPYIYYISERKPLQLYGNDREGLLSSMQENGARYVLFYVFENPEPELYREMLGGPDFRKISSYSQWGDPEAAVIYEHVTQRTSL